MKPDLFVYVSRCLPSGAAIEDLKRFIGVTGFTGFYIGCISRVFGFVGFRV